MVCLILANCSWISDVPSSQGSSLSEGCKLKTETISHWKCGIGRDQDLAMLGLDPVIVSLRIGGMLDQGHESQLFNISLTIQHDTIIFGAVHGLWSTETDSRAARQRSLGR